MHLFFFQLSPFVKSWIALFLPKTHTFPYSSPPREERKKWEINGQNLNTDNEEKEQTESRQENISVRGQLHGFSEVRQNIQHLTRNRKIIKGNTTIEGIKKFPSNKPLKLASLEEKETMLSTNFQVAKTRCYTIPQSTHLYTTPTKKSCMKPKTKKPFSY